MKKFLSLISLWGLLLSVACAADVRFTASASSSQVAVGEQFEVSFTINTNADHFNPPSFSGFQLLSGPNQTSSMSMINGVTTQSISLGYILAASKEGTYTIGPATVNVNGRTYSTNPIKITVVKGQPNRQSQARQRQPVSPFDDDFDQPQQPAHVKPVDIKKNVFVKADVTRTDVYQGDKLTVTYKLYTTLRLQLSGEDKTPDLNGFWKKELFDPAKQQFPTTLEVYGGKQFNVITLKKTLLYPEHSGNLTLDPIQLSLDVEVPLPPRNAMEQMFGGPTQLQKLKVSSQPITVHVKPLPQAGKPAGFTNAVGNFKLNNTVDKKQVKANDAINYTFTITGEGNISLLQAPPINFPPDFEKYDPKVTDTIAPNGLGGKRTFTFLLIPRHQGNYTIEAPKFAYFNPATGKYVSISGQAFDIKVDKGTTNANTATNYAQDDKQDVKTIGTDIRYIKTTDTDLVKANDGFYGSVSYWLLIVLGPLVFAGVWGYRQYTLTTNADVAKVKSRRAAKVAAKHLANAQQQLSTGNDALFYEALSRGLYGYLADKLNLQIADLDKETIAQQLQNRGVDNSLSTQLTDTLNLCQMARFAPVSNLSAQQVFNQSQQLINQLQQVL